MKLTRIQPKQTQVQEKSKVAQNRPLNAQKQHSDTNSVRAHADSIIPHGKYKDKTVLWVMSNDKYYWDWIVANNLVEEWGLYKEPQVEQIVFTNNTFYSRGYQWLGLRIVDNN